MRQKDCYRKKGWCSASGKVVVVAVEATKEVPRTALVWALTNVAQPGDCIKLLGVIPCMCSNSDNRIRSLCRLATDCITSQRTSRLGTVSDQRQVCVNSCSQMVLQLHEFYDPEKIKIRIKIISGSLCGAVAAEAKRAQSSWVILDKKLKNEKKYCMEELSCSVVIIERSRPNVLRLNLISSRNMKQNAFPRNIKENSKNADTIRGPVVNIPAASSLKQGSNMTESIFGQRRGFSFSQKELKNVEEGESNSQSGIILSLSSSSSYFQPWTSNKICVDDEASVSQAEALVQKLDHDVILGVLNCKLDVNLNRSVTETISLVPIATTATPPLCSFCQHKAPLFGNPLRWFTFSELQLATDGFSQPNLLAEDEFGSVHRGVLPDEQVVAIKRYNTGARGDEEFLSEIEVLSCTQHRNVVMLIGFCVEDGRKFLVYEYVCNGSLYSHLHGKNQNVLNWHARQKIALGAARGLRYLHEECRVGCIVHRDVRPSNILLTHDFEALVGNFGLARWHTNREMDVESRVPGTLGYLAPECTQSGQITKEADVFFFGVLLLELVTGRKALDKSRPKGQQCLHEWARPLLERHEIDEIIDPSIRNCDIDQVHRMLQCSSLCIQQDPHLRPRMSLVLQVLEGYTST
ncbi:inactive protein kinase SELMODRAFT_444075 isoform X1 [Cajanus cajan]|uniref:inactive protein kinase SELMODRAFT_444075 isoform X1 n=1 Tax=Cajanus cajan TaxID=3821 RepID=UPI0010FB1CB8|nr:inactive protein kinase SELMODRAFT_444075 isoform X1 [Cajanus cajan]